MELKEIRDRIDVIDAEILRLFLERMSLSEEVAEYKISRSLPVLNREREEEILENIKSRAGENGEYAKELFSEILTLSRKKQEEIISAKKPETNNFSE